MKTPIAKDITSDQLKKLIEDKRLVRDTRFNLPIGTTGIPLSALRTMVRSTYALQQIRIQIGNRICAQWHLKLGRKPGEALATSEGVSAEDKKLLGRLKLAYRRITEAAAERLPTMKNFKGVELIDNYAEFVLLTQYMEIEQAEQKQMDRIKPVVEAHPVYEAFSKEIGGLGQILTAVLITSIDIHETEYVSSMWKYCGLDVAPDGRGRGMYKEHMEEVPYLDKNGNVDWKKSLTYNPWLKTKLLGTLAVSILMAQSERRDEKGNLTREAGKYRKIFDDYKNRLENHPKWQDGIHPQTGEPTKEFRYKSRKLHRLNAAKRYMIKMLLQDLYAVWRKLAGLPVAPPYAEAKLGMIHGSAAKYDQVHLPGHVGYENMSVGGIPGPESAQQITDPFYDDTGDDEIVDEGDLKVA